MENIPLDAAPRLYVSNHVSFFETMAIPMCVVEQQKQRQLRIAAKEELLRVPLIGAVLKAINTIPVKRKRGAKAYRDILESISRGNSVLIFPEGTRSRDGEIRRANRGLGRLIIEAQVPVVPIRVDGLHRWRLLRFRQQARLVFGEPLKREDLWQPDTKDAPTDRATEQQIADKVMEKIRLL